MAQVTHNKFTTGLSGKFGNLVFRQMKDGRTIVSSAPDFSDRVFSEGQLNQQSRFQQASAYASAAQTQQFYKELAMSTGSNAYRLALSDWFKPPVIHEIRRLPGLLRINATDNVHVEKVYITILNEDGITLERGSASLGVDDWWEYETEVYGKVLVEAFDPAGNVTLCEA